MAKFRRNHGQKRGGTSTAVLRLGAIFLLCFSFLLLPRGFRMGMELLTFQPIPTSERFFVPNLPCDSLQHLDFFSRGLGPNGQLWWVAYPLSREQVKWSARTTGNKAETSLPQLISPQAMSFSENALQELPLSAISLNDNGLDHTAWATQEALLLDWAVHFQTIYVTTGLYGQLLDSCATGQATGLFQAVLDLEGMEQKGIAFIQPFSDSLSPAYVTIDSLERLSQMNLFAELIAPGLRDSLKSHLDLPLWGLE